MTLEQQVRDQLVRATEEVLGGPDVESSIGAGRRRRRHRRAVGALSIATAAALVVASVSGAAVLSHRHGDRTPAASQPSVAGHGLPPDAASVDFVPGTGIDELMAQVVADHLSGLPTADDIYPSDADHDGPMPDADFALATDWQAVYTSAAGTKVSVTMAHPGPGYDDCGPADCTWTDVPGGVLEEQSSSSSPVDGARSFTFFTQYVAADGSSMVNVREQVRANTLTVALAGQTLDHGSVVALVTDHRLTF